MKKIEYVIQKYVDSWSDLIVYSEDEPKKASDDFRAYTDNYKKAKFRLIVRTTTVTEEKVFQKTF
jgi:hypothetical protein